MMWRGGITGGDPCLKPQRFVEEGLGGNTAEELFIHGYAKKKKQRNVAEDVEPWFGTPDLWGGPRGVETSVNRQRVVLGRGQH